MAKNRDQSGILNDFSELSIEGNPPSQRAVFPKRKSRIDEAIGWASGTQDNRLYQTIYEFKEYRVCLGKPGKEENESYTGIRNEHDMRPELFFGDKNLHKAASFSDIAVIFEEIGKVDKAILELTTALLFRSAFLLDHLENKEGKYRFAPSEGVLEEIEKKVPSVYEVPTRVFLHYLDAIAWNEDVKYFTKGKNLEKESAGAKNNLLSYVNFNAVLLEKLPLSALARLFSGGVAPIGITKGTEFFLPKMR